MVSRIRSLTTRGHPAHHMDSCTTLTVYTSPGLQFPSSIALLTHAADCTDYTHKADSIKHAT